MEICANWNSMSNCKDCPIGLDACCENQNGFAKYALDLIRRLQYGYSSASKASEEWKEKYEKERQENVEQKAEIERLTEEKGNASLYSLQLFQENEALKKQVDEFADVFGNADNFARMMSYLRIKNGHRIVTGQELLEWIKYEKQQAVKDTAKEILQEVSQHYGDDWLVELYKRYGVEVE